MIDDPDAELDGRQHESLWNTLALALASNDAQPNGALTVSELPHPAAAA